MCPLSKDQQGNQKDIAVSSQVQLHKHDQRLGQSDQATYL